MSGEEPREDPHTARPRGLQVMARVRWALLAAVTGLAATTVWTLWLADDGQSEGAAQDRYYCPMHPEIRSPSPGECPICHMYLEPIPDERRGDGRPESGDSAMAGDAAHPDDVMAVTLGLDQQNLVGISTSVVEQASSGGRVRVPGVVSAPESGVSQVRVRAPGFVERVLVRQTGVEVERGQTLAYIYSPEVYRAQEELLAASRWSAAASEGAPATEGSGELVAAARRGLELLGLSKADIDGIVRRKAPIRALPVRAGAGGVVTRYAAVPGSRADPEMVLYEISDLSELWVTASVHEHDLGALRVGESARFVPTGEGEDPITGRIELIEPSLAEATQTTRVRLVVANEGGRMRPGQFGEVELELPKVDGLFVPTKAVIRTGKHDYVYVAIGAERFEPRTVRTGPTRDGRVQVLEGLEEGDRVVTRGSFMLDSESRLQSSLAGSPPAEESTETTP